MRYDLIDLGRDVLARLTTPISQDFVASLGNGTTTLPNATECKRTGEAYLELLMDLDTLVGADTAFLLGSWVKMAYVSSLMFLGGRRLRCTTGPEICRSSLCP